MIPPAHQPRIVSSRGKSLSWTPDDRLWLLRAVEAEGEPRDLVAQVLVNRWAMFWDELPGKYTSLGELVRAYAQPVNPAWFPDGRRYLQSVSAHQDDADYHALLRRAIQRRDVHSTRTHFSPGTLAAVDQALRGPIVIPPGALHYAAATSPRDDLPVLVEAADTRHNVIYGEPRARLSGARYSIATALEAVATGSSSAHDAVAEVVGVVCLGIGFGLAQQQQLVPAEN